MSLSRRTLAMVLFLASVATAGCGTSAPVEQAGDSVTTTGSSPASSLAPSTSANSSYCAAVGELTELYGKDAPQPSANEEAVESIEEIVRVLGVMESSAPPSVGAPIAYAITFLSMGIPGSDGSSLGPEPTDDEYEEFYAYTTAQCSPSADELDALTFAFGHTP